MGGEIFSTLLSKTKALACCLSMFAASRGGGGFDLSAFSFTICTHLLQPPALNEVLGSALLGHVLPLVCASGRTEAYMPL